MANARRSAWTLRRFTPCEECERTGFIAIDGQFAGEIDEIECPKCQGAGHLEDSERVCAVPVGCTAPTMIPVHLAKCAPTIDDYDPFAEEVAL
jgi:DnaJ-class molecular chaperone